MPAPADPAPATGAASAMTLVAQGSRAYAAGRTSEAIQLLDQARAGAAREPAFWELDSAIALATGDADRGVAALEQAVALTRRRTRRLDPRL